MERGQPFYASRCGPRRPSRDGKRTRGGAERWGERRWDAGARPDALVSRCGVLVRTRPRPRRVSGLSPAPTRPNASGRCDDVRSTDPRPHDSGRAPAPRLIPLPAAAARGGSRRRLRRRLVPARRRRVAVEHGRRAEAVDCRRRPECLGRPERARARGSDNAHDLVAPEHLARGAPGPTRPGRRRPTARRPGRALGLGRARAACGPGPGRPRAPPAPRRAARRAGSRARPRTRRPPAAAARSSGRPSGTPPRTPPSYSTCARGRRAPSRATGPR